MIGFKVRNNMSDKIRAVAKEYREKRIVNAAKKEAEVEVKEMQNRTPVDTRPNAPHPGQLRDSIHAEEPELKGDTVSVTIATTSAVSQYDKHVHENPDAIHPIGQWKYMESVLNESRPHMKNRLAAHLQFDKK